MVKASHISSERRTAVSAPSASRDKGNSKAKISRNEVAFMLILVGLCLVLFFFRLGARPLWDTDEGMHAATSKDMVLSGDWITPRLNGENFYDKPVLHNWLVAISFVVFGFTEFAARFPAAILGLGCVLITYLLGKRMFNPVVGLLSGSILATSIEFIILSRVVVHDISLVFFLSLALYLFYRGYEDQKNRRACFLLGYASMGFAALAKGPLGLLLPALIAGLFLILKRRLGLLKEMELAWGMLIFLGIAAPWYILISLRNPDYSGYFFVQQNLMSFLSQEARHPRPFYYYFPVLLGGFLPWSFFLPLALFRAFQEGYRRMGEGTLFVVVWFGAIFLFFSIASSKLSPYILPLFPAASLMVGLAWHDLLTKPTQGLRRGFLYSYLSLVVILLVGGLYIQINPLTRMEARYGIDLVRVNYFFLLVIGSAVVVLVMFIRAHYWASFSTLAGAVVVSILFFVLLMVPSIDPYRSTKGLAQKLDAMLAPEEELVFFEDLGDSALFYTNRRAIVFRTPQELKDYLASERRVFCVIEKEHYRRLENLEKMTYVLGQEGRKLLISNKRTS
jgi:4-amino-4-deoxy-L-arabinose transferase-like glycosyltransferase